MENNEFQAHRLEIVEFLNRIKNLNKYDDFIVVGSSVFILNDININRRVDDVDIIVYSKFEFSFVDEYEEFKLNVLYTPYFLREYTEIEGFKVITVEESIQWKQKFSKEGIDKHLIDLKLWQIK